MMKCVESYREQLLSDPSAFDGSSLFTAVSLRDVASPYSTGSDFFTGSGAVGASNLTLIPGLPDREHKLNFLAKKQRVVACSDLPAKNSKIS